MRNWPTPGDRVTVDAGKHAGKTAVMVRWDLIMSGQTQAYPVVKLEVGTVVRVRTVTQCANS